MYCRNCGAEVPEKAEICVKCGTKPMNAAKFCWNCGTETSDAQEICVKCGVNLKKGGGAAGEGKDWLVTLLLAIFLGGLGIHRFYVGLTGTAVVMLCLYVIGWILAPFTLGITGLLPLAALVWALIDIISIATGKFKDKDGNPLVKK